MKDYITVTVEYFGRYMNTTGRKTELLQVPPTLSNAYEKIQEYLSEKYGIVPPYIIMANNMSIIGALKKDKDMRLTENDVFKLVPFISGG